MSTTILVRFPQGWSQNRKFSNDRLQIPLLWFIHAAWDRERDQKRKVYILCLSTVHTTQGQGMGLMAIGLHTPSPRSRSHSFSLFWSSLIFYGQNFENRWPYLCHRHFMLFNASVYANGDDTHFCGGLWRRFRPLGRTVVPIRTVTRPPHNPQTSRASCIWNINYCNIHLKLISDTHTHTHTLTHTHTEAQFWLTCSVFSEITKITHI